MLLSIKGFSSGVHARPPPAATANPLQLWSFVLSVSAAHTPAFTLWCTLVVYVEPTATQIRLDISACAALLGYGSVH